MNNVRHINSTIWMKRPSPSKTQMLLKGRKKKKKSNPSSPTSIKEIKLIGKNIPRKKIPNPDGFNGQFYQTFKK